MRINSDNKAPSTIKLGDTEIKKTNNYRYLGVQLNTKMDWDEQWNHIGAKFNRNSTKTMKTLGFKKEILVNVYKSLIMSHVISNAHILCSVSAEAKGEIERVQNKALNAIGIKNDADRQTYKIEEVDKLINKHCEQKLTTILDDPSHYITKDLKRKDNIKTRNTFPFAPSKCRTTRYEKTFVQKYIRVLETNHNNQKTSDKPTSNEVHNNEKLTACNNCGKLFKGLRGVNMHKRTCMAEASKQSN